MDPEIAEKSNDDIFYIQHKPHGIFRSLLPLSAAFIIIGLIGLGAALISVRISPDTPSFLDDKTEEQCEEVRIPRSRPSASRVICR